MDIPGVYEFSATPQGDIVELARSVEIDNAALLEGQVVFEPNYAYDQTLTLVQKLVIADVITTRNIAAAVVN